MKSGRPITRLRSHSRLVPLVLFVDLAFAARCNRQGDPAPPSRHQFAAASAVRIRTVTRTRRSGRSEEHTSELQSLMRISYAVFCLTKKHTYIKTTPIHRRDIH